MSSLHILYASTAGHTEYVIDVVIARLAERALKLVIEKQRVEKAMPEDFAQGDVLLLACGTWNTGTQEGQLNPHMHAFLRDRAKAADLGGKKVAVLALGDARYHFTARAHEHLVEYVRSHNGALIEPTLKIINEPYGQEEAVHAWIDQLLLQLS